MNIRDYPTLQSNTNESKGQCLPTSHNHSWVFNNENNSYPNIKTNKLYRLHHFKILFYFSESDCYNKMNSESDDSERIRKFIKLSPSSFDKEDGDSEKERPVLKMK